MAPAMDKPRWGELDEEDGEENLDFLLPPRQVIGPDNSGIKKIVEYKFNDDGNKVKTTTTTRVRKLAKTHLSKCAVERRSWLKFGDAIKENVSARLTMVSTEEIVLERLRPPGSKAEGANNPADPLQANKGGYLMVCRTCGKKGDHWTSKCLYKDLSVPTEVFTDKLTDAAPTKEGVYRPPTLRNGGEGPVVSDMRRRNDENSVRVTNLSEDTQEADIHELFRPFGNITRVYVAIDHNTGSSRGIGFFNFASRDDAERVITKLNGYGYDNLYLESRMGYTKDHLRFPVTSHPSCFSIVTVSVRIWDI